MERVLRKILKDLPAISITGDFRKSGKLAILGALKVELETL